LRDHRLEPREEERADVEGALLEQPHDLVTDLVGVLETDTAHAAQLDVLDDLLLELAPQLLVALTADAVEFDLLARGRERVGFFARKAHDRRIERAAQTALRGADHEQMHAVATGAPQQPRRR